MGISHRPPSGRPLQIIMVNIILSGDNAWSSRMACRNLRESTRSPAIFFGSAGAIVLRIVFVLIVDRLLHDRALPQAGGRPLLLWIGVKLVRARTREATASRRHGKLWAAIRTIIIADAVMSLDNAIAIAAAAKGDFSLIVIGLVISIPDDHLRRHADLHAAQPLPRSSSSSAARLIGWIAGEVLATDPAYADRLAAMIPNSQMVFEVGAAVITVVIGYFLQYRARRRERAEPVDLAADRPPIGARSSDMAELKAILVAVDGSRNSDRAVQSCPQHAGDRACRRAAFSQRSAQSRRCDLLLRAQGADSRLITARKATSASPRPSNSPRRHRYRPRCISASAVTARWSATT